MSLSLHKLWPHLPYGNIDFRKLLSLLPPITLRFRKDLFLFVALFVPKWLLPPAEYLTLPFFVNLNLFATPFLVFSFPIYLNSFYIICLSIFYAIYFGAITRDIILPSKLGFFSTWPSLWVSIINLSKTFLPKSRCSICLPLKKRFTLTLSFFFKNAMACFT